MKAIDKLYNIYQTLKNITASTKGAAYEYWNGDFGKWALEEIRDYNFTLNRGWTASVRADGLYKFVKQKYNF